MAASTLTWRMHLAMTMIAAMKMMIVED